MSGGPFALHVLGDRTQPQTISLVLTLLEKALPFTFEHVDTQSLPVDHWQRRNLSNPSLAPLPMLSESTATGLVTQRDVHAITRKLDTDFATGNRLWPSVASEQKRAQELQQLVHSAVYPEVDVLLRALRHGPRIGKPPDTTAVRESVQRLQHPLDELENALSSSSYLVGSSVTLVDLFVLPSLVTLCGLKEDAKFELFNEHERPALTRWTQQMQQRKSWQQLAQQPFDSPLM